MPGPMTSRPCSKGCWATAIRWVWLPEGCCGSTTRRSPKKFSSAGTFCTRKIALRGAAGTEELRRPDAAGRLGADAAVLEHLAGRYGGEARTLLAMVQGDPSLGAPLVPGLPYLCAEAVYAARYEMARTLDDVLSRRTRARLLARDASARVAGDVARLVAPELGWDDAEVERQARDYRAAVATERDAAGLPESAIDALSR